MSQLCVTPWMAAHGLPLSPGILNQEALEGGLPFHSPNKWKWKWKWSSLAQCPSWGPMDCSPPGSSAHGISQKASVLEWVAIISIWTYEKKILILEVFQVVWIKFNLPGLDSNSYSQILIISNIFLMISTNTSLCSYIDLLDGFSFYLISILLCYCFVHMNKCAWISRWILSDDKQKKKQMLKTDKKFRAIVNWIA